MRLLCLCDSPTVNTGFARVAQNLLKRWHASFGEIDVWGINFNGWPHELPYRIYPAGFADWATQPKLQGFISRLEMAHRAGRPYTHVWLMQDTFGLSNCKFPAVLSEACTKLGARSFLYFPVDAPLEPGWADIIRNVDVPVAYCEWGREQAVSAIQDPGTDWESKIRVLPHGVDTGVYRKLPDPRFKLVEELLPGWLKSDDVLIVNVSANQPRKGIISTFQTFKELKLHHAANPIPGVRNVRLLMHMTAWNVHDDSHHLEILARQMGLKYTEDWRCTDEKSGGHWMGNQPLWSEEKLNKLYNAADLFLTTTLGEGWGLPITEAAAAGCPVAAPYHTACAEILDRLQTAAVRVVRLPVSGIAIVNSTDTRVRFPVNYKEAAYQIYAQLRTGRVELPDCIKEWLSWDRIADEWMKLFKGE